MFLIRPRPYLHESLSSWRQRCGLANGFLRFPRPAGQYSKSDPDRIHEDERDWLVSNLGVDEYSLSKMTLDFEARFLSSIPFEKGKQRWLLSTSQSKTIGHHAGPVFCRDCLAEDKEPYFRLSWRFAYLSHCPTHGGMLQDRCSACSSMVWPASRLILDDRKWNSLSHCPKCGFDLSQTENKDTFHIGYATCLQLWETATLGAVPHALTEVATAPEYLTAIWVLCQLMLRKSSTHLIQSIPGVASKAALALTGKFCMIEQCPIHERSLLVSASAWLLENWPARFVDTCTKAGITRAHFVATRDTLPSWMTDVINAYLTKRQRGVITIDAVHQTLHTLAAQNQPVSKVAVRQALGVSESIAIDSVISQRRHATKAELKTVMIAFETLCLNTSQARAQQASLIRDFSIFLLSVLLARPIEQICSMTKHEVKLIYLNLSRADSRDHLREQVLEKARYANNVYAAEIRPSFLKTTESSIWFVSRFGAPLEAHSVRLRLAKMIHSLLPNELWNSADVFIHSLGNAPLGRRSRKRQTQAQLPLQEVSPACES